MRIGVPLAAILALYGGALAPLAYAQKGMGEPTGVARQAVQPEVVSLSGKVLGIETGPCKMTTGRSPIGTHFLIETAKGEKLNVHLGPAAAVGQIADQLAIGNDVTVEAFRTAKMPEGHYVAQSVAFDGKTIRVRDEDLRPFWLQGGAASGGRGVPQAEPGKDVGSLPGRGQAYGRGPAWGRGPGYGRGPAWGLGSGYGRGPAWGRGPGYGRGPGRVAGRGRGLGRGWGAFVDEDGDGLCDNFEGRWAER